MLTSWTHIGPTVVAAFLASLVEFVEALTVVLAVGVVRGWRGALVGSGAATLTLLAIIALLGPLLTRIPLDTIQLAVGVLLLLFGMRWLRKAILRASGIIAMHDEASIFAEQEAALRQMEGSRGGLDTVAVIAAFKITMLEGIEVVFIVIALGAGGKGLLIPASLGALAALLVVVAVGAAVHRPLSRVPENTLKFVVGVLLSAFGTFWVGEGLGLTWPGEDWSIPGLIAGFLVVALIAVPIARAIRARRTGLMARDAA
jgi:Ca2+/H+ antiporter, TMEM165/GDT1 family